MVVRNGIRVVKSGVMFSGDGVSVWKDEKVLEADGGDGCTTK